MLDEELIIVALPLTAKVSRFDTIETVAVRPVADRTRY